MSCAASSLFSDVLIRSISLSHLSLAGTPLSMMKDVGSGGYASGQRAHPLTWTSQDNTYINERPIGTQQTGYLHFLFLYNSIQLPFLCSNGAFQLGVCANVFR